MFISQSIFGNKVIGDNIKRTGGDILSAAGDKIKSVVGDTYEAIWG